MARVALISSWNAVCGVSIHAELIGRALLEMGHELRVFAPIQYEDDETHLCFKVDKPYVLRNYSFLRYGDRCVDETLLSSLFIDTTPLLVGDFDLLIVEKPSSLPLKGLMEIFPHFKGRTLAVLHECRRPENPYFYRVEWDTVTVFDERYQKLFSEVFPEGRLHIVPYPCHPIREGDKTEEKRRLGLPDEVGLLLSFGRLHEPEAVVETLQPLCSERPELRYLCLVGDLEFYKRLKGLEAEHTFLDVRFDRPPIKELYRYLIAADALLIHKAEVRGEIRLSSTAHLCLGSLTPILCPDVSYFNPFDGEVLKYRSLKEMRRLLSLILDGGYEELEERARRFVEERSAERVAERLLQLALGEGG
jgi:hypothetical protein